MFNKATSLVETSLNTAARFLQRRPIACLHTRPDEAGPEHPPPCARPLPSQSRGMSPASYTPQCGVYSNVDDGDGKEVEESPEQGLREPRHRSKDHPSSRRQRRAKPAKPNLALESRHLLSASTFSHSPHKHRLPCWALRIVAQRAQVPVSLRFVPPSSLHSIPSRWLHLLSYHSVRCPRGYLRTPSHFRHEEQRKAVCPCLYSCLASMAN